MMYNEQLIDKVCEDFNVKWFKNTLVNFVEKRLANDLPVNEEILIEQIKMEKSASNESYSLCGRVDESKDEMISVAPAFRLTIRL